MKNKMHKYTRLPVYTKEILIILAIQRECFFPNILPRYKKIGKQ